MSARQHKQSPKVNAQVATPTADATKTDVRSPEDRKWRTIGKLITQGPAVSNRSLERVTRGR